jgi:hypothetical protein
MKIKKDLQELQEEQAHVAAKLAQSRAEQEELKHQKDQLEQRLNAAQRLTNDFQSEKIRWTEDQEILQKQFDCVIVDCVLASAFLCYLGPLNQEYQSSALFNIFKMDLVDRSVLVAANFNLGSFLADEAEIFGWRGEGLALSSTCYPTPQVSILPPHTSLVCGWLSSRIRESHLLVRCHEGD